VYKRQLQNRVGERKGIEAMAIQIVNKSRAQKVEVRVVKRA
jgi:hypothetical protein